MQTSKGFKLQWGFNLLVLAVTLLSDRMRIVTAIDRLAESPYSGTIFNLSQVVFSSVLPHRPQYCRQD